MQGFQKLLGFSKICRKEKLRRACHLDGLKYFGKKKSWSDTKLKFMQNEIRHKNEGIIDWTVALLNRNKSRISQRQFRLHQQKLFIQGLEHNCIKCSNNASVNSVNTISQVLSCVLNVL